MKAFLVRHGEKLFLAVVVLLGGWSLAGSIGSLSKTTALTAEESKLLGVVQEHHKKNQPPAPAPLMYAESLAEVFKGRSSAVQPIDGRIVHAPPSAEYGAIGPVKKAVDGRIDPPSELEVKAERGRVTLSWRESSAENATVVKYEVFRAEGSGARPAEPLRSIDASEGRSAKRGGGLVYTFVDSATKAETSYTYWVRAAGREVEEPRLKVTMSAALEQREGLWFTAPVEARARTPSDIEFECTAISLLWMKKHAVITIKRWDSARNDWEVFRTDPGIPEGEEIKGFRMVTPVQKATIETGYLVKKVVEETIKIPKTVTEFDETGKKIVVTKFIDSMVQKVIVEHPGKKDVREIVVRAPGAAGTEAAPSTPSSPAPRAPVTIPKPAAAPAAAGSVLDQFRKQLEKREGEAPPPAPTAPASAAVAVPGMPAAPAPAGVYVFSVPSSTLKVEVPAAWQGMGPRELLGVVLPCTDETVDVLMKGVLAALKGTGGASAMVLHDFPPQTPELQAVLANEKMPPEDKAARLCDELLRKPVLALKSAEPRGEVRVLKTAGGNPVAAFEASLRGKNDVGLVLARYCGFSTERVYALSFVCLEKDIETERKLQEQVVATMTW